MLKNLSAKDVVSILLSFGFEIVSQKGSHIKLKRDRLSGKEILIIPDHDTISKGTLKSIFNQASVFVSKEELFPYFFSK